MSRKTKQKVNELVKARAQFAGIGTRKAKLALNKLAKTEFYAHAKEQPTVDLHCGHVLEVLETIPSESVTCCKKQYKPFYSVQPFETVPWELLDQLIKFYCPLRTPLILDSTVNKGRIWGSSHIKYIGMDIDPFVRPNLVGDHTQLPFPNDRFDVIVYDPPHTGEQGKSTVAFAERYGVGVSVNKQGNLFDTYPLFISEAARVLKSDGLLLVKLADCTHRATFHFATAQFWLDARDKFKLQGLHILPRKNVIIDPKWKKASHPRQNHCTWMAFTKSRVRTVEACQCAIALSPARIINVDSERERRYEEFRERMLALAGTELAA